MKLEFYRQIFEKNSNIKFHETPSSCSAHTDGHNEANSRFSQFANTPKCYDEGCVNGKDSGTNNLLKELSHQMS